MINFDSPDVEVVYRNPKVVFFKTCTNGKLTHRRSYWNGSRLTQTSTLNKAQFYKEIELCRIEFSFTQSKAKHL